MTQADHIGQFALDQYVPPARAEGRRMITIRAGDIHRDMKLANAMPAVCSAIGSNKFEQVAQVTPINRTGPANGANAYFQFTLGADAAPIEPASPPIAPRRISAAAQTENSLYLTDALVLVSC